MSPEDQQALFVIGAFALVLVPPSILGWLVSFLAKPGYPFWVWVVFLIGFPASLIWGGAVPLMANGGLGEFWLAWIPNLIVIGLAGMISVAFYYMFTLPRWTT